jgi:hypothetical protein
LSNAGVGSPTSPAVAFALHEIGISQSPSRTSMSSRHQAATRIHRRQKPKCNCKFPNNFYNRLPRSDRGIGCHVQPFAAQGNTLRTLNAPGERFGRTEPDRDGDIEYRQFGLSCQPNGRNFKPPSTQVVPRVSPVQEKKTWWKWTIKLGRLARGGFPLHRQAHLAAERSRPGGWN